MHTSKCHTPARLPPEEDAASSWSNTGKTNESPTLQPGLWLPVLWQSDRYPLTTDVLDVRVLTLDPLDS